MNVDSIRVQMEESLQKAKEIIRIKNDVEFEKVDSERKQLLENREFLEKELTELKDNKSVAHRQISHTLVLLRAANNFLEEALQNYESLKDNDKAKQEALEKVRKEKLELISKRKEEHEKRSIERQVRAELSKEDEQQIKAKVAEEVTKRKVGRPKKQ